MPSAASLRAMELPRQCDQRSIRFEATARRARLESKVKRSNFVNYCGDRAVLVPRHEAWYEYEVLNSINLNSLASLKKLSIAALGYALPSLDTRFRLNYTP